MSYAESLVGALMIGVGIWFIRWGIFVLLK